jgi:hypothetical protein
MPTEDDRDLYLYNKLPAPKQLLKAKSRDLLRFDSMFTCNKSLLGTGARLQVSQAWRQNLPAQLDRVGLEIYLALCFRNEST